MAVPVIFGVGVIAPLIATVIKFIVGTFIARTVAALGIAVVTYNITSTIGNVVKQHFLTVISSGSGDAIQIAMALGVHSAANIIFSAYMGALAIRAAMGITSRLTFGNSGG